MYLKKLELINYRNYERTAFDFSPTLNLIIGGNAQGKTNVLEAIYYLSSGTSHRVSSDNHLVKQGETMAAIKSLIAKDKGTLSLEAFLSPVERKRVKVGGVEKYKFTDLLGHLRAVIFSPEDLQLVKAGPDKRRSFLDDTIVQIHPTYHYWCRKYARILRQRNILLKSKTSGLDDGSLDLWDRNLVQFGTKLIVRRLEAVRKIRRYTADIYKTIAQEKETLNIDYLSRAIGGGVEGEREIAGKFNKELLKRRKDEIERKVTLVGPHRDDMTLFIDNTDVRLYGSQGQQRSVALALKLAQFELIQKEVKEKPLLLLDDVMSELDQERRSFLIDTVQNDTQVFVTATSKENFNFNDLGECKVIEIQEGSLIDSG